MLRPARHLYELHHTLHALQFEAAVRGWVRAPLRLRAWDWCSRLEAYPTHKARLPATPERAQPSSVENSGKKGFILTVKKHVGRTLTHRQGHRISRANVPYVLIPQTNNFFEVIRHRVCEAQRVVSSMVRHRLPYGEGPDRKYTRLLIKCQREATAACNCNDAMPAEWEGIWRQ
jgi:hypothetical protein